MAGSRRDTGYASKPGTLHVLLGMVVVFGTALVLLVIAAIQNGRTAR